MKILRAILILGTVVAFIALSKGILEHKGRGTSEWVIVWSAWIGIVLDFICLWQLKLPPSRVSDANKSLPTGLPTEQRQYDQT